MVSLLKTVKNTDRLRQILQVLVLHGFGELLARTDLRALLPGVKRDPERAKGSTAQRLRRVLQELGPSFVKLGQIASTRTDLLPAEVIAELEKLQDDVPPLPLEAVVAVLRETLAGAEDELLADLSPEPLAAASIGQVHTATLRGEDAGREVVVKIQRPGIRGTIARDLDLLYLLAGLIERHIPESRVYAPLELVREFDRAITAELDYTLEADNALRFAANFEGDPTVRFPHVYRHASGKRVLTMERFHGEKIDAFLAAGGDGPEVARRALRVVARMIFEHGFFHADPHPGNILLLGSRTDPVIGLIDLGLVGQLSPAMRDKAVALMLAAVQADPDALADALLAMGRARTRVDQEAFRADVALLSQKYLGKPLAEVELAAMINDLVQGAIKYDIEMPPEMMMVGKSLMTIEGIGKKLDPELDVWTELRPFLLQMLWERYRPERLGKDLLRGIGQLSTRAGDLPAQVHDILDDLRAGRLAMTTTTPDLALTARSVGRRLHRTVWASSMLLAGALVVASGRAPWLGGILMATAVAWVAATWAWALIRGD